MADDLTLPDVQQLCKAHCNATCMSGADTHVTVQGRNCVRGNLSGSMNPSNHAVGRKPSKHRTQGEHMPGVRDIKGSAAGGVPLHHAAGSFTTPKTPCLDKG